MIVLIVIFLVIFTLSFPMLEFMDKFVVFTGVLLQLPSFCKSIEAKHCPEIEYTTYSIVNSCHYSMELIFKYRDSRMVRGDPVAVFKDMSNPTRYLVTFKASQLQECTEMTFITATNITCWNIDEDIKILSAYLYCFEFELRYLYDIIQACIKEKDYDVKYEKCSFVALHYVTAKGPALHKSQTSALYSTLIVLLSSVLS